MEDKSLVVGGYRFSCAEDARLAKSEWNKVRFFDSRMKGTSSENMLNLYKMVLEDNTFRTPVGMDYLRRLRRELLENGIEEERIPEIPVTAVYQPKLRQTQIAPTKKRVEMQQMSNERKVLRASVMLNIILVVMVIAMFVITLKSDNPNIINYEKALLNKYAAWEQELTEREEKVREAMLEYHINDGK